MDTTWKIQKAVPEDAERILALNAEAVRQVNSKDYLPEQAIAWLAKRHSDQIGQWITDGKVMIAVDEGDKLVGFASRSGGAIHGFYTAVDQSREAIGAVLLAGLEADAKKEGIAELIAMSLLAMESFYLKNGFVEDERQQRPLASGISIEVVVMRKTI